MIGRLEQIFTILQENNRKPTTELYYTNNFTLLVAVILSAQSQDRTVNVATRQLFNFVSTPEDIVRLGLDSLMDYIKIIGLYKTKARNIFKMSETLIKNFSSAVPNNFNDLISLSGVGTKTAYVILNTAFNLPVIAVDTHIFRVAHRLNLSDEKSPEKVGDDLMRIVPPKFLKDAHHWLILHGRYVCTAKKPRCKDCCISHLCQFKNKNLEN